MSRPGSGDPRLSESYKQRFRELEGRSSRQAYTLDQQERKIFELANGLKATQERLEERDDQLRAARADVAARDQRLLALAQHFGHDSVGKAETTPPPLSNDQLADDLKASRAKLSKLSSRERRFHEAQAETLARVEEAEEEAARLEQQVEVLKEAERVQRQQICKLEEVERGDKAKIHELEERLKTPPPTVSVDKENRILQPTHTPVNSAPSTPTKPRTPGRAYGLSLSPHKSPSKLSTVRLLNTHKALEAEHRHITQKYAALVGTHEAVCTAYAADKRKWHAMKEWLYGDEPGHREEKADITGEERRKYEQERIARKRRRFIEVQRRLKGQKEGSTRSLDKPDEKPQVAGSISTVQPAMTGDIPKTDTLFLDPPASSPRTVHTKRPQPGLPTEEDRVVPKKRVRRFTQASSDTEDDSQALPPLQRTSSSIYKSPTRPSKRPALAPMAPETPPVTSTASTGQSSSALKAEPSSPVLSPIRPRRAAATAYATPVSVARPPSVRIKEEFVEGSSVTPLPTRSTLRMSPHAASGPPPTAPEPTSATNPSLITPLAKPDKPHRKGAMAPPAGDYSAYKGRGRYGRAHPADAASTSTTGADTSINAAYEINPEQNGGQNFAFDEVVRGRAERMRLPASDCLECRAYYEGIGELPERLQRPRWRSPDAAPDEPARGACSHHSHSALPAPNFEDDAAHRTAIEQHKAGVSRHRQQWPRPSTPPGFWDIGMPDTQEQAAINERAEEMRQAKHREVETEAERQGGRWRKR